MSEPPADSDDYSIGPPDRQTLRLLKRHLVADSLVAETAFDPDSYEPNLLRGFLDAGSYPGSIASARLDIRWFTTGDVSIHYIEEHEDGARWECRWDRHPNPHNSRIHFHEPPTATEIIELELSLVHPLEVCATVLTAIKHRIETLWGA